MKECPKCGKRNFEEVSHEVDVGVGSYKWIIGGVCEDCGNVGFCRICGIWETANGLKHEDWCDVFRGEGIWKEEFK